MIVIKILPELLLQGIVNNLLVGLLLDEKILTLLLINLIILVVRR